MTFKLEINCDNAAFEDDYCAHETARILKAAAKRLEADNERDGNLFDYFGNRIGHFAFKGKRKQ